MKLSHANRGRRSRADRDGGDAALIRTHCLAISGTGNRGAMESRRDTVATGLRGGYHVTAPTSTKTARPICSRSPPARRSIWSGSKTLSWRRRDGVAVSPRMINADAFDIDKDGYPEVALQSVSAPRRQGRRPDDHVVEGRGRQRAVDREEFDRMPSVHRVRWIDAERQRPQDHRQRAARRRQGAPPDYKDKVGIYAYNPRNGLEARGHHRRR